MSDLFSGVTELISALVSAGTGDTAYRYKALLLDKLDGIEAEHRELTTRAEAAEQKVEQLQAEIGRLMDIKVAADKMYSELRRYGVQVRNWSAVEDAMQAYKDLSGGAG